MKLDVEHGARIYGFKPDPSAPLSTVKDPRPSFTQIVRADRQGLSQLWQLGASSIRRWKSSADELPETTLYRPKTLDRVAAALDGFELAEAAKGEVLATHEVAANDKLSTLAVHYYQKASKWPFIFEANRDVLDDTDELFARQRLRDPKI